MSVIQQILTSELEISALKKHALAPLWTVCGQVSVKFLQIMLIIKETIIAKCQTCLLTQTFRVYNPSSV